MHLLISISHRLRLKQQSMSRPFFLVVLPCAQPHMQATSDPHNTFEVTVPPLLTQDQSFNFTFHPARPGPVVSSIVHLISVFLYHFVSDDKDILGQVVDCTLCLGWPGLLPDSCSAHANTVPFLEGRLPDSCSTHTNTVPFLEGCVTHSPQRRRSPPPRPRCLVQRHRHRDDSSHTSVRKGRTSDYFRVGE